MERFFWLAARDERVHCLHVSLYMSLCYCCLQAHGRQPFSINHRQIMQYARINGIATYHKGIQELQAWGYLRYEPSYHPVLGSSVYLLTI